MKVVVLRIILSFAMSAASHQALNAPCKHTVTGQLQVFRFDSKVFGNTRMLRVWLPPGYDDAGNGARRYPVLYMFDGQNLFDACTASDLEHEWQVDETLTRLIAGGKVDPMIVVGIDNAGASRLNEYLPWRDVIQTPDMPEPDGRRLRRNTAPQRAQRTPVSVVPATVRWLPCTWRSKPREDSADCSLNPLFLGLETDSLYATPLTSLRLPNERGLGWADGRRTIPVCI